MRCVRNLVFFFLQILLSTLLIFHLSEIPDAQASQYEEELPRMQPRVLQHMTSNVSLGVDGIGERAQEESRVRGKGRPAALGASTATNVESEEVGPSTPLTRAKAWREKQQQEQQEQQQQDEEDAVIEEATTPSRRTRRPRLSFSEDVEENGEGKPLNQRRSAWSDSNMQVETTPLRFFFSSLLVLHSIFSPRFRTTVCHTLSIRTHQ